MSQPEFARLLAAALDVEASAVGDDTDLVEELGLDSLGMLELVTEIEDAVGGDAVMPIELVMGIRTVRDAYLQYCALAHLPFQDEGHPA